MVIAKVTTIGGLPFEFDGKNTTEIAKSCEQKFRTRWLYIFEIERLSISRSFISIQSARRERLADILSANVRCLSNPLKLLVTPTGLEPVFSP